MCVEEMLRGLPEDTLIRIRQSAWEKMTHKAVVEYFQSVDQQCPACGARNISKHRIGEYSERGNVAWANQTCYDCKSTWVEVWHGVDVVSLLSETGDPLVFREEPNDDLPDLWGDEGAG